MRKHLKLSGINILFIKLFIFSMGLFTLFRGLFVWRYSEYFNEIPIATILKVFVIGSRFDISMTSYFLLPLFVIGSIPYIGIDFSRISRKTFSTITSILYILVTSLLIIDLEFYAEFDARLNLTAVEYLNTPGLIIHTIKEQYPWITYLLLFLAVSAIIFFALRYIFKSYKIIKMSLFLRIFYFILFASLFFLGIRGRIDEGVLNWGLAFFSEYNIANQATLNPIYNLSKDLYYMNKATKDKLSGRLKYYDTEEQAIGRAKEIIADSSGTFVSEGYPIYRYTDNPGQEKRYNIVIVLMEQFSGELCGALGGSPALSPEFDRLSEEGVLLKNFFSGGVRTNRGISATLCSYPTLVGKSILVQVEGQQSIPTLPSILREKGYSTTFMYGGDLQFDNMQGFMQSKGIDRFIGQDDFGSAEHLGKWGVADEVLFDKAVEVCDSYGSQPFFTMILTLTNHPPYLLPESPIEPQETGSQYDANYNTYRYADYCLGRFIDKCRTKDFFDNTIFVVLGDHSRAYSHDFAFDYRNCYVPCMIYAPSILESGVIIDSPAGQMDIAPTLLGMMNMDYYSSFWGRDLFHSSRKPFAFVVKGDLLGLIEDGHYFCSKIPAPDYLHIYGDTSGKNISGQYPELSKEMKDKAYAIEQAAYYLYKSRKIAPRAGSIIQ